MDNRLLDSYKASINRLQMLLQAEKNAFSNATDDFSKTVAGAKVQAFEEAINILFSLMKQNDD
jgi:hypothetical protein